MSDEMSELDIAYAQACADPDYLSMSIEPNADLEAEWTAEDDWAYMAHRDASERTQQSFEAALNALEGPAFVRAFLPDGKPMLDWDEAWTNDASLLARWLRDAPAGTTFEVVTPADVAYDYLLHSGKVASEVERLRVRSEASRQHAVEQSPFGVFDAAHLMTADGLAETAETLTPWIEGVLEADSLSALIGESYSGKSYLSLDWAFCVATGTEWNGHAVKQGRVLYLAMEGARTLAARVEALKTHHGIESIGDALVFSTKATNLHDEHSIQSLVEAIQGERFDLVVVDTISRSFGGQEENSSEAMGNYVKAVDQLREAREGTTVLLVGHPNGENAPRPRGHTSLYAALDACWLFPKPEDVADGYRELINVKWKPGTLRPVMPLRFTQVSSTEGASVLAPCAQLKDKTLATLAAMLDEGEVTRAMLKTKLVGDGHYSSENAAGNRITALVGTGQINATSNRADGRLTLA